MTDPFRLEPHAYFDPDWLNKEQQRLFSNAWVFAGTVKDFAAPGDYRLVDLGPASIAVISDKSGQLSAVHNFCRHRGARMLETETGNAGSTIVCPYHRWTYGLDGGLRGVPDKDRCFPDLDRSKLGLKPAAIGTFKEFVFVNPNAGGPVRGLDRTGWRPGLAA